MHEDSPWQVAQRVAEALAREAGQRAVRQRRAGFAIGLKAKDDLVTDVDTATERFVVEALSAIFDEDIIEGEEYGVRGSGEAGQRRWLIDPIDGTLNFSQGIPYYGISIALQHGGRTQVGVVYDPSRDELFSARRGGGAFLDGQRLEVSTCEVLDEALLVTGFAIKAGSEGPDNLEEFMRMMKASRTVRRMGSAALDLCYVAAGRFEGFWEYNLSPWDTAAGYLLVEEAGGRVTTMTGQAYSGHEASILASNTMLHEAMQRALAGEEST